MYQGNLGVTKKLQCTRVIFVSQNYNHTDVDTRERGACYSLSSQFSVHSADQHNEVSKKTQRRRNPTPQPTCPLLTQQFALTSSSSCVLFAILKLNEKKKKMQT